MFINVNRKYDFDNLSYDDIVELIEAKKQKEIEKVVHNWEEEGIRVEKARWGRHMAKRVIATTIQPQYIKGAHQN